MIFCSSSLMAVDENAHCTNALLGGRQVFFLTVIEVEWSSELILLKLFVRPPCVLGTLGLSARGWADLNWFVPADGGRGDNLHALPEVWPSPLCPSNCRNFNAPLNEVLIMIVIKRDGQFASSVRPGQEIWTGQRWEIQARDTHENILLNIEG